MAPAPSARDDEAMYALALLDAPGFGARRVNDLLEKHDSARDAFDSLSRNSQLNEKVRNFIVHANLDHYRSVLGQTEAVGGSYKLWCDSDYPANLGKWAARPTVLFYKGNLELLGTRALALVGRVDPTDRGVDAAARFSRLCVENDIQVISGLAKGIDGASHRGALVDPPGTTFAVLGHGLDHAYPAENKGLYAEIPQHGALISQFATGVGPQRWTFPARNEVMCTLALGTVIIEGKEGCGSIIQAEFSFKHERPVFLLSRNLKTEDNGWALKLVDRGAHVIEYFEQAVEIVEKTNGDLWGEKLTQGQFFDVESLSSKGAAEDAVVSDMLSDAPSPLLGPPPVALFDLDGVVIDSRAAQVAAIVEIAERHLGREVDEQLVDPQIAPHKALASLGVPNAYSVYQAEYKRVFDGLPSKAGLFPEMVRSLERLKANGVALGAITNQPKWRMDLMLPPEVKAIFAVVFTYGDTGGDKVKGIRLALSRLNGSATCAVYVGDQPKDLEAARKAGVGSVGVLWGFSTSEQLEKWAPDILLDDQATAAEQILALLDR